MKWWFIFSLALYFGLHSLLANDAVKQVLQRYLIPRRFYRLFYNAFALISLLPVAYLYKDSIPKLLWNVSWLEKILALGFLAAGVLMLWSALRQYDLAEFGGWAYLRGKSQSIAQGKLQTQGWNSRVRHPLYFTGLWIVWSFFFLFPTDLVLAISLVTTLYTYIGARWEEQKLIGAFGAAYRVYQQEVPMLLPVKWKGKVTD